MSDKAILDADVYDPVPSRPIRIGGVQYLSFRAIEVPYDVQLAATRLKEHLPGKSDRDALDFLADIICEFVPSLSRDALLEPVGRKKPSIIKLVRIISLLLSADPQDGESGDPQPDQSN